MFLVLITALVLVGKTSETGKGSKCRSEVCNPEPDLRAARLLCLELVTLPDADSLHGSFCSKGSYLKIVYCRQIATYFPLFIFKVLYRIYPIIAAPCLQKGGDNLLLMKGLFGSAKAGFSCKISFLIASASYASARPYLVICICMPLGLLFFLRGLKIVSPAVSSSTGKIHSLRYFLLRSLRAHCDTLSRFVGISLQDGLQLRSVSDALQRNLLY